MERQCQREENKHETNPHHSIYLGQIKTYQVSSTTLNPLQAIGLWCQGQYKSFSYKKLLSFTRRSQQTFPAKIRDVVHYFMMILASASAN
jgi:hypothetical protein